MIGYPGYDSGLVQELGADAKMTRICVVAVFSVLKVERLCILRLAFVKNGTCSKILLELATRRVNVNIDKNRAGSRFVGYGCFRSYDGSSSSSRARTCCALTLRNPCLSCLGFLQITEGFEKSFGKLVLCAMFKDHGLQGVPAIQHSCKP